MIEIDPETHLPAGGHTIAIPEGGTVTVSSHQPTMYRGGAVHGANFNRVLRRGMAKTKQTMKVARKKPAAKRPKGVSRAMLSKKYRPSKAVKTSNMKGRKRRFAVSQIDMPPGSWMRSVAQFLFSKRTVELVFEPLVADYRHEVFEAMVSKSKPGTLRRIGIRHWLGFAIALLLTAGANIGQVVRALKGN